MTDPGRIFDLMRRSTAFTVTEEHLKLLRCANVGWEYVEFGAPAIDGKRPYGNSDVLDDIAEILELDPATIYEGDPEDREMRSEVEERLSALHAGVGVALQIALITGEFRTGTYVKAETWSSNWKRED